MKLTKSIILAGSALAGLFAGTHSFAQSTATETVESQKSIIVTGKKSVGVIKKEVGSKSKTSIDQNLISQGTSGQSIAETLNVAPGYNFTNSDAYGSSGGNVRLRGMDGSRISLTVDGTQLNDSGNYAIFTNQQLEPELICSASVNTGATDVDSMSASASGGTINYSSCNPEKEMGGVAKVTFGDESFRNLFIRLDSGAFGPFGTRAYFAYTGQTYDTWTREAASAPNAKLKKHQFNFKIHQDIANGGFISMAAHYNENRNRFYFSNTKTQIYTPDEVVFANPSAPTNAGYAWNSAALTNINPSDTGNIRIKSKFVLTPQLTVTIDPTYQYVLANGGGNVTIAENSANLCGTFFGTAGCGTDINGDGDKLDSVFAYHPNNTNTHRLSLSTSAIYRLNDNHTFRLGASFDRARHRQTGELGRVGVDGNPVDVFAGRVNSEKDRVLTQNGVPFQKRNRFSEANVDVFSIEYRGRFMDDMLTINLGLRDQKMTRNLNQYCYSLTNGTGTVYCSDELATATTVVSDSPIVTLASRGTTQYFAPYKRTYTFKKTLPNVGATFKFDNNNQVFMTYAESMSSPRTDSYYNVQLFGGKLTAANPEIETSTNTEMGYRYTSANFYAVATLFDALDKNRIVSSFDPDSGAFLDRNIGDVKRKGFEAQTSYSPVPQLTLNAGLTYTEAKLQSNLIVARVAVTNAPITIATANKTLVETPKWMWTVGGTFDATENLQINLNGKYVGDRYTTDINDDVAPNYFVWNGSARYKLEFLKPGTYVQLNVHNIFDKKYLSNITSRNNALPTVRSDGGTFGASAPSFNVGAPRTMTLALRAAF